MTDDPRPTDPSAEPASQDAEAALRRPAWRRALIWVERIVTAGLLVFVAIRLGPQIGALIGVSTGPPSTPAYTLVTLKGDTVRSADLAGKVVVVNFWATWCVPCRLEMPSLEKLHRRHAGDDLVVLGISVDVGGAAPVRDFLGEHDITYAVGRVTPELRRAFGSIPGVPTTFVLDRTGTVRHRVVGYFTPPALEVSVSRLLGAPAP